VTGDAAPAPFHHLPVLLDRVVALFAPVPPGWIVDATLGGGGHAEALLDADPTRRLLGLDQDAVAIAAAGARLARFGDRVRLAHVRFDHLAEVAHDIARSGGGEGVSGVLFDLGVSSPQLDEADRGFSFRGDGPLDMRMDRRRARTAADLVNNLAAQQLADTIRRYGDERFAYRIAKAIVAARPIQTTGQLADVVANAVPAPARRTGHGHPARRTFQALRIAVNEELEILADSLDQAIDLLTPGGRCIALAYHSGEDRIVKDRFRLAVTGGCECPPGLPCACGAVPTARFVKRGAEKASAEEIEMNRRSESVRLRVIEAIEPEVIDLESSDPQKVGPR
jgi:16S rRNA (cytosine1402-N4)-methyltransferase